MATFAMNRRTLIGAAALAFPVAAARGASIMSPAAVDRAAWGRAYAVMEHARLADAAYDPIYMRAFAAYAADFPNIDALECRRSQFHPHFTAPDADDLDAYETDWLNQRGATWQGDQCEEKGRRAIAEVREYRRLREAAKHRHNIDAIEAEWERLGDVLYDAQWALFELPAPDLPAFLWKSEHLFGDSVDNASSCSAWSPDIMATYMADARRLLGREV